MRVTQWEETISLNDVLEGTVFSHTCDMAPWVVLDGLP